MRTQKLGVLYLFVLFLVEVHLRLNKSIKIAHSVEPFSYLCNIKSI